jgi:archaellum component FlaC
MSNADSEEVSVVVERGGVSVEKSFEPDDFPVPAIAFVIHSDRDETTNVRIVDQVPDDVPAQDIGFHPKYGADFWSVEDDEIVFEREFEAGEEYTTVYGLRAKDTDEVERFLTEPTIEGVEGEETVSDIIGDEADDADADDGDEAETDEEEVDTSIDLDDPTGTEQAADADDEEPTRPEPAEASADDLESAIADLDETGDGDEEAAEGDEPAAGDDGEVSAAVESVGGQPESAGNGASAAVAPEDLAAALAAEIRDGDVADEDLETLREALGADLESSGGEVPGHVEARIDKLQGDVDEVVAYTGALESFLDDAGSADELLEMREEFDDLRGSVDELEGTVAGMDDRLDEVAATTESLEGSIETLHDDVADLESGLSDLESQLADLEDDIGEDLSERVADLEHELDEMEEDIETLDNLRQALAGD